MTILKHLALTIVLLLCAACWSHARAQKMPALDLSIDSDRVRFEAAAQEMKVEVYAPSGEMIFDSGAVTGQSVEWKMQNALGERVADGVYLVTISMRTADGQVRKRIEEVVVGPEQQGRAQQSPNSPSATITGTGTTGKIAKFTNTSVIGDSVMLEASGKVGIGISTPTAFFHVKEAGSDTAIAGVSTESGIGVRGSSKDNNGVRGESTSASGVRGTTKMGGSSVAGVHGISTGNFGTGVIGEANSGQFAFGVLGLSTKGIGVQGQGGATGVIGKGGATGVEASGTILGLTAFSSDGTGVQAQSDSGYALTAITGSGTYGVLARTGSGKYGVYGSGSTYGVYGTGNTGVYGKGDPGVYGNGGVMGVVTTDQGAFAAVYGKAITPGDIPLAGYFQGNVQIDGNLSKSGGDFKIDHPLDPANKYLYHSFVESPDMMNIYNGNITLDQNGEAVVTMPKWFNALNRDFRYQLTPIGAPGPNLYIAEEVKGNHFKIGGGSPGMKVSWQVTGIRRDAWAEAHRIPVEVEKPEKERGFYLHPELFNQPEEKGVTWALHPELMQRMKERREKQQPQPSVKQ